MGRRVAQTQIVEEIEQKTRDLGRTSCGVDRIAWRQAVPVGA